MRTIGIFIISFSALLFIQSNILAQPIPLSSDDSVPAEMIKKRGKTGKELFDKATEFFLKKEYDKAIEYCEKAIDINPDDYEVNYLLGLSYAEKGDFRKAVEYYQKSTNVYPNEMILIAMSTLFSDDQNYSNNLDKTIEGYKNEIAKNPNNYQAFNDLGYLFFLLKGDSKFEEYYKKSIEIKPDYAQAHYNLAIYYLYYKDRKLALDECNILGKLNKDLAKVILRAIDLAKKNKADKP